MSLHNRHSVTLWDLNQTAEFARAGKALDVTDGRNQMRAFHLPRAGAQRGKSVAVSLDDQDIARLSFMINIANISGRP